jgi:hypothetical protein
MKKCSLSLATKEMQIKTKLRLHLTPVRITIIKNLQTTGINKDVGGKEPSYTGGRNVSYCIYSGKQYGGFLKI